MGWCAIARFEASCALPQAVQHSQRRLLPMHHAAPASAWGLRHCQTAVDSAGSRWQVSERASSFPRLCPAQCGKMGSAPGNDDARKLLTASPDMNTQHRTVERSSDRLHCIECLRSAPMRWPCPPLHRCRSPQSRASGLAAPARSAKSPGFARLMRR